MPVDPHIALIAVPLHRLSDHPYHPHDAQDVIHVFMGHKDIPDLLPVNTGILHLPKQTDSPSAVYEEMLLFLA